MALASSDTSAADRETLSNATAPHVIQTLVIQTLGNAFMTLLTELVMRSRCASSDSRGWQRRPATMGRKWSVSPLTQLRSSHRREFREVEPRLVFLNEPALIGEDDSGVALGQKQPDLQCLRPLPPAGDSGG